MFFYIIINSATPNIHPSLVLYSLKLQVERYKPEVVWSDGEWEAPDSYWQSKEFLAWLYNTSPVKETVVVNDRWGHETLCKHGGFYTCTDRYNPGKDTIEIIQYLYYQATVSFSYIGVIQPHKWENCMTLDKESWGYRRNAKIEDFLTAKELMTTIVESVSCGGMENLKYSINCSQ